jgi:HSP20 family protein
MNVVMRRDPFSLLDEMYEAFSNRAGYPLASRPGDTTGLTRARMDVVERDNIYEIKIDMPGVKKDDIHIDLNDNHVAISATALVAHEVKAGERTLYAERQSSQFARSFDLPQSVIQDKAEARYENGVLTLSLPKKPAPQGHRLAIR